MPLIRFGHGIAARQLEAGVKPTILAALSSVALLAACSGWRESALRQGDSLERDLKPGEAHVYLVPLAVGESALIVVKQMGVDVVVEVRDPAGKTIASVDSPNGRNGDE